MCTKFSNELFPNFTHNTSTEFAKKDFLKTPIKKAVLFFCSPSVHMPMKDD